VSTLQDAAQQLAAVSDTPRDEAEWLLAAMLGIERQRLRLRDAPLNADEQARYSSWLHRRAAGEPLAYITGEQPFWKYGFTVSPDVLIPRPDTECLVETALFLLATQAAPQQVLDACTGSGCVAISLALDVPDAEVWATDISPAALAVASANAQRLKARVQCLQANGLQLPEGTPLFNLITANPPYIAEGDGHLPALQHEPQLALVSGTDGLNLIRTLIADAPRWLQTGGALLLEHGYDQGQRVRDLFSAGGYTTVTTRRDLGGNERVTYGFRP
jgi:release factor glutamine methyltransferase